MLHRIKFLQAVLATKQPLLQPCKTGSDRQPTQWAHFRPTWLCATHVLHQAFKPCSKVGHTSRGHIETCKHWQVRTTLHCMSSDRYIVLKTSSHNNSINAVSAQQLKATHQKAAESAPHTHTVTVPTRLLRRRALVAGNSPFQKTSCLYNHSCILRFAVRPARQHTTSGSAAHHHACTQAHQTHSAAAMQPNKHHNARR